MLSIQVNTESTFSLLQQLVGEITEGQLKHVEYYVGKHMGICIPSTGFCEYAIKRHHTHPSYSFVICFSENLVIEEMEQPLIPYHYKACLIPPEYPHEEEFKDNFTRYFALFVNKDYFENCYKLYERESSSINEFMSFLVPEEILQPINLMIKEAEGDLPGKESILDSLTELIVHQIIRSILNITTSSFKSGNGTSMSHIIDYMYQHFDKKLEIAELAKMVGLSESYFIRRFKKETHSSPMMYLDKIRINNAKNLLRHSNENISEIALMCGFNNCSHFSSRFSKEVGISPFAYKKNYRD